MSDLQEVKKDQIVEIKKLLDRYGVLFFKNQDLSAEQYVNFSTNFGIPAKYPMLKPHKNFKDIYVVGDSIDAGDMPKSSFSAESQAKILSLNLVNRILQKAYLDPVFLNTCYSFSSYNRAFSITSWYKLNSNNDNKFKELFIR